MPLQDILAELNIISQCRKYGISLWQCPQFLFLLMGGIVIISMIATYFLGARYIEDPLMVALMVSALAALLLIIGSIIVNSFERLAEASRMKTEFVNIVSHQLRTPLTNMKWALEMIFSKIKTAKEDEQPKYAEYINIVEENNKRMSKLIGDLLIVARIEQGRLPSKEEEIDLKEFVKKAIDNYSFLAQASNVEVGLAMPDALPKIIADSFQLGLVIDNLLSNAIRYSNPKRLEDNNSQLKLEGKGRVQVRVEKRDNNIYFEVKDNGVGIPKEDQKYIFQKFFRSSNVLRYQTQGTGLGLFIAKSIIDKNKGKIGFQSQEGKGSTFWFTIPIKS